MKKIIFLLAALPLIACSKSDDNKGSDDGFTLPALTYQNDAEDTPGGEIYDEAFAADPQKYFDEHIRGVVAQLYFSENDPNIPATVETLKIVIDPDMNVPAWATTSGTGREIHFWPTYIETYPNDKAAEISGIVFHELTHTFQLNPTGATLAEKDAFIEGMADAVRPLNIAYADGGTAQPGGSWLDKYRTTGWFLVWLKENKDPDFLRKFNATAISVRPWSWDRAMKSILGESATTQELWDEYLASF